MRKFENQAFRFGQNFQHFRSDGIRGAGKSAKFVRMGTSGLKMSKFVLENCQICAATNQER